MLVNAGRNVIYRTMRTCTSPSYVHGPITQERLWWEQSTVTNYTNYR